MARAQLSIDKPVVGMEDEAPWQVCRTTNNLGVHQVAQADAAGSDGCCDADIVEHTEDIYLVFPHIEQKSDEQSDGAAMTGQTLITMIYPFFGAKSRTVLFLEWYEHLYEMRAATEEIPRFIE